MKHFKRTSNVIECAQFRSQVTVGLLKQGLYCLPMGWDIHIDLKTPPIVMLKLDCAHTAMDQSCIRFRDAY